MKFSFAKMRIFSIVEANHQQWGFSAPVHTSLPSNSCQLGGNLQRFLGYGNHRWIGSNIYAVSTSQSVG
jgi:hypothetical protein